jgi:hypothetical protein
MVVWLSTDFTREMTLQKFLPKLKEYMITGEYILCCHTALNFKSCVMQTLCTGQNYVIGHFCLTIMTEMHNGVQMPQISKHPVQWHTEGGGLGGSNPPKIPKALQNHAKLNPIVKTVKNC